MSQPGLEDAFRAQVENRPEEALAIFQSLAAQKHLDPRFWLGLTLLALQARDLPRAKSLLQELKIRLRPDSLRELPDWILPHFCLLFKAHQWQADANLILALDGPRRADDVRYILWEYALSCGWVPLHQLRAVLGHSPWPGGWEQLGKHHLRAGQFQETLTLWLDLLTRAGHENLHLPVAQLYLQSGDWSAAQAHFRAALDFRQDAAIYYLLGRLHVSNLELTQARHAFRSACQLEPHHPLWQLQLQLAHLPLLPFVQNSAELLSQLLQQTQALAASVKLEDCLPDLWQAAMDPFYDLTYLTEQEMPWRQAFGKIFIYPEQAVIRSEAKTDSDNRRLAYLITPGHEGLFLFGMSQILAGICQHWQIDLLAFESSLPALKPLAQQLGLSLRVLSRDLKLAIEQIQLQDYALLNCWEAGVDPLAYYLSGFHLGRKQFTSWESVASTGHPGIAYFISSPALDDKPEHFSEHLIHLPVLPFLRSLDAFQASLKNRSELGLPEGLLIAAPHNLLKFSPAFAKLLKALLETDADLQLVLIESPVSAWTQLLKSELQRLLPDCYAQICWLPRQSPADFLAIMQHSDLILDSFPVGAGKVAFEAAALGVPVLTLAGKQLRGRVTAAVYQQMGISGLTTQTPADYLARAQALLKDPLLLAHYSEQIMAARPLVFENEGVIPAYLEALETILAD